MKTTERLIVTTPSDREIMMARTFDAPRHLVWEAMTKPEFIKRWLYLPDGWSMVSCEHDVRVGGTFRWACAGPDGNTAMVMHGVHRDVVVPERIVRTETFEFGCPSQSGEQLVTMILSDMGNRTKVAFTAVYPSTEARDGALASGMEHGVSVGYDQLDELLAEAKR